MPTGHHHRRHSPSPYSESSGSSGIHSPSRGHRSRDHRSHKPHKSSRNSPKEPPPPPSYYADEYNQRPKLENRRPELQRSLSEDTYRQISGNDRHKDHHGRGRGYDKRTRTHDSDDDYYYYDKHGRPHTRSLSNSSRSRSRSRSRDRRGGSRHTHHSTIDSLKPIAEDVMAAFGLVSAKHAKDDHRGRGHRSRSRDRSYHDRNTHKSYKSSRSASRGGSRSDRRPHNDYIDTMMDPGRSPSTQSAALRAAITAAALEAFRTRKEFGGITPERLLRIAGAAIAAGGLDAIVQRDKQQEGGTRNLIESVIGGMKSSSAFGHRIRRRHGLAAGDQMKYRLMQAATAKILDRPFRPKDRSLAPKNPRSRSSTGLSSLMKSMAVQ